MILGFTSLAIDDARLRSSLATNRDGLAPEFDIPIPVSRVGPQRNQHGVAVIAVVDGGLDGKVVLRHTSRRSEDRTCHTKNPEDVDHFHGLSSASTRQAISGYPPTWIAEGQPLK